MGSTMNLRLLSSQPGLGTACRCALKRTVQGTMRTAPQATKGPSWVPYAAPGPSELMKPSQQPQEWNYLNSSHFLHEKTEAQRGKVTCPTAHSF